jgi:hypothetical protein
MPEAEDDVRGMRDEATGRWEIVPVQDYNDWKFEKFGVAPF